MSVRPFAFDQYLERLRLTDLERYHQLVRLERVYTESHYQRLLFEEMLFDEQMSGYADPTCGSAIVAHSSDGNWAWKPGRHVPDPGKIFTAEERAAFAASRGEVAV